MERTSISRSEGKTLRPVSVEYNLPGRYGIIYFHFSREDEITKKDKEADLPHSARGQSAGAQVRGQGDDLQREAGVIERASHEWLVARVPISTTLWLRLGSIVAARQSLLVIAAPQTDLIAMRRFWAARGSAAVGERGKNRS